jgi:feruloyl esterase
MTAPKLAFFLGDLGRRAPYLFSILLILSCGGPEVPVDLPEAVEWRFDEPQPDWKVATPQPFPPNTSARGVLVGGVHVEVPAWDPMDWAHAVAQVRSQTPGNLQLSFNVSEPGEEPLGQTANPFEERGVQVRLVGDNTVQTYRISTEPRAWAEKPIEQLGLWIDGVSEPTTVEILSVSLVPKTVSAAAARKCAELKSLTADDLPNPTTVITFAHLDAAHPEREGDWVALPEHCRIQGKINERMGEDGLPYAINFRMRLPTDWNGRFFFEGTGGGNGRLTDALGATGNGPSGLYDGPAPPFNNALSLGYAVVNEDGGWDRRLRQISEIDLQAHRDHKFNSVDEVTKASKALIRAYYGKMPEKSYLWGGSEGGEQGMAASQRYPTHFDGIVAMAPPILRVWMGVRSAWNVQTFAEVARAEGLFDEFGSPLLPKTFTDDDFVLVSNAVLEVCDTLDGLADGIVDNFPACTNDLVGSRLAGIICTGPKEPDCLTAPQVTALLKVHTGARNSRGELLFPDPPWDAGIGGKAGDRYFTQWRNTKIGPYNQTRNQIAPSMMAQLLALDFDTDPRELMAPFYRYPPTDSLFWELTTTNSTDLSAFKERGSKLIIIQGVSDPYVSWADIVDWWEAVDSVNDGTASDFVRLFAVLGGSHILGNDRATDRFDALSAIVDWVENGIPPDKIIGTAGPRSPWPNRTRPLCPWPQQARYKGSGSIEVAENFDCVDVVRN